MKIGKKNKKGMNKPLRPCLVCSKLQSCLKRHILTKHKNMKNVSLILHLGQKGEKQDTGMIRKQATKIECMGFYYKSFKTCHQLNCPGSGQM